jgi:hypothetical protein
MTSWREAIQSFLIVWALQHSATLFLENTQFWSHISRRRRVTSCSVLFYSQERLHELMSIKVDECNLPTMSLKLDKQFSGD